MNDTFVPHRAVEVERSGSFERLLDAADRLVASGATERVLQVPERHMFWAAEALECADCMAIVENLGGTKRVEVRW